MKFGVKEMRNELMEKAGEELEKKGRKRKGKRAELKREVKKSESGMKFRIKKKRGTS